MDNGQFDDRLPRVRQQFVIFAQVSVAAKPATVHTWKRQWAELLKQRPVSFRAFRWHQRRPRPDLTPAPETVGTVVRVRQYAREEPPAGGGTPAFFDQALAQTQERARLSDEHMMVDEMLIEACSGQ